MKKHIITLIFIGATISGLFIGCTAKKDALGAENQILIIAAKEDQPGLRDALSVVFYDTIYSPSPEPFWILNFAEPDKFSKLETQTLFGIGTLSDNSLNKGRVLIKGLLGKRRFNDMLNKHEDIILTRDQYAGKQLFMILASEDQNELKQTLLKKRDWIRKQYFELFKVRQSRYLFDHDRQKKVENKLKRNYQWSIKIPYGWDILHNEAPRQFFWMGREMPYQWFSVHWETGLIAPDNAAAKKVTMDYPETFYKSVRINPYKLKTESVDFENWTAWKTTGVWESIDEPQGGPFTHYIFYDGVTNRTYQIDYLIYYPGADKAIRMGQMDLIAHTFAITESDGK